MRPDKAAGIDAGLTCFGIRNCGGGGPTGVKILHCAVKEPAVCAEGKALKHRPPSSSLAC